MKEQNLESSYYVTLSDVFKKLTLNRVKWSILALKKLLLYYRI